MPSTAESQTQEQPIHFEGLLLDPDQRKALFNGTEITLNRREFDLLYYLVQHAESAVTREAILQVFDKEEKIFDRTIDSHISHLRGRFKKAGIQSIQISSIYGVGYRLEKAGLK